MLKSMYGWTIFLLLFLAAVDIYIRQSLPVNIVIAIALCSILDVVIKKIALKKNFNFTFGDTIKFPYSAFITGIIIGSIAQFGAPPTVVILASIAAILSKFIIRLKGNHVFNPAAFGLLVSLTVLSSGDEWWAAASHNISGYTIPLSIVLILANYKADKLGVSIPFFLASAFLFYFTDFISIPAFNILNFIYSLPFYFGFIMVSEPKTSPYGFKQQAAFGVLVSILMILLSLYNFTFALFGALLLGNIFYAVNRTIKP